MKLSNRLQNVVNLISPCGVVADIGCDHGKVLHYVLKNNIAQFVFGSDISQKSVEKTAELLKQNNYVNFKTLTSDGLKAYENNELELIGCIVIAGMGGNEIISILEHLLLVKNNLLRLKTLILQPQNNVVALRNWLQKHNFFVEHDWLLVEKEKFYNILKVIPFQKTQQKLSEQEILFGKTNLVKFNPHFLQFLQNEIEKTQQILKNINKTDVKQFEIKLKQLQNLLQQSEKLHNSNG